MCEQRFVLSTRDTNEAGQMESWDWEGYNQVRGEFEKKILQGRHFWTGKDVEHDDMGTANINDIQLQYLFDVASWFA